LVNPLDKYLASIAAYTAIFAVTCGLLWNTALFCPTKINFNFNAIEVQQWQIQS